MDNKFIPIEKRDLLLKSIKVIRDSYLPPKTEVSKRFNWIPIIPWLFSGFGIFIASIGAISIIRKLKSDKETEVDIVAGDAAENYQSTYTSTVLAYEFERMVGDVLDEIGVLKVTAGNTRDGGYDFLASSNSSDFIVEVKRYSKLLGLGTARDFVNMVNKSGKGGILIVSSGVTERVSRLIDDHNKISHDHKIYLVIADSKKSVKEKLKKIFK